MQLCLSFPLYYKYLNTLQIWTQLAIINCRFLFLNRRPFKITATAKCGTQSAAAMGHKTHYKDKNNGLQNEEFIKSFFL
jgi:hypothetical protein